MSPGDHIAHVLRKFLYGKKIALQETISLERVGIIKSILDVLSKEVFHDSRVSFEQVYCGN